MERQHANQEKQENLKQPTIQQGLIIFEDFLNENLPNVLKQAKNIQDILAGTTGEIKKHKEEKPKIMQVTHQTMAEKFASNLKELNCMVMDIGETLHYIEHQIK